MASFRIPDFKTYQEDYAQSIKEPEVFWKEMAEYFYWHKAPTKIKSADWEAANFKWYEDGMLNITENCLDRYEATQPDKTAMLWVPNDPNAEALHISYAELYGRVCRLANALESIGIQAGDKVGIYMPMVPEAAVAMLACARIGAVHSVVFAGFSANALSSRLTDCDCKLLITAEQSLRGDKIIDLFTIAKDAVALSECVTQAICLFSNKEKHGKFHIPTYDFQELVKEQDPIHKAKSLPAEQELFVLYTSGSTGKPKGMVHTAGGYMVQSAYSFYNTFQIEDDDIFWCTADVGWVTGHSYIVYGPLLMGATTLLFEGIPTYPEADRFWNIIEEQKVSVLYTAPTAIRSLMQHPTHLATDRDLGSLRVLGSVGEPINEEAWHWYDKNIGGSKCPIVDTWWQTETGCIMISALAGITKTIPSYATLPLPGVYPAIMDDEGKEIWDIEASGRLAIKQAWPSMARTIFGDHERFKNTYFSQFEGMYFSGDGAIRDKDFNYRITGRVDDVVIVSGHNLGTAPIENEIDEHPSILESAVVGFPHAVKGQALYAYVIVEPGTNIANLLPEVQKLISSTIGAIAKLEKLQIVDSLPKTRSGKIMRRILRKIACDELDSLGDISTLVNPESVEEIISGRI